MAAVRSRQLSILARRVPHVPAALSRQIVGFVQKLRARDLFKVPGVAETLDWAQALVALDRLELDPQTIDSTLGVILKYQDDLAKVAGAPARSIFDEVARELAR